MPAAKDPMEADIMKKTLNKGKKTLSILLALVLTLGTLLVVPAAAESAEGKWVATWGTSPVDYYISLANYASGFLVNGKLAAGTLTRTELSVSSAGEKLRLKFSNEYGDRDVSFTNANIARTNSSKSGAIEKSSVTPLTFGGSREAVIPAGGVIWSDEINFKTDALEKLTVSLYFSKETPVKTAGLFCGKTYSALAVPGAADESRMLAPSEISIATGKNAYHIIPFLTAIDTYTTAEDAYSAVFIGDSTLVNGTTQYLSRRLVESGEKHVSIINEGIMGNRLFYDGHGLIGNLYGKSVTERFQRDALDVDGCEVIVVKIGVNDILHPSSKSMGDEAPYVSTDDIIKGYEDLVNRAHENGKRIYFMEITPWKGYVRDILGSKGDIVWSEELQAMCDECNEWIKTNDVADGYIESDNLAKPGDITAFRNQFTKDGIHLTEAGALALADCIDLEDIFGIKGAKTASEIYGVNPYEAESEGKTNQRLLKIKNILLIVRQLLSTLRVEYGPLQKILDKIIDLLPDSDSSLFSLTRKLRR